MENTKSGGIGLGTISFIVLIVLTILANWGGNPESVPLFSYLNAAAAGGWVWVIAFDILAPLAICLIASIAILVLGALVLILIGLLSSRR